MESDVMKNETRWGKGRRAKINNQFRKRVKQHIKNSGMTVQDFAELCSLTKVTIEKIIYEKSGWDTFEIFTIDKVCNQIEPNLYYLFEGVEII